jgi:hypothetical protein
MRKTTRKLSTVSLARKQTVNFIKERAVIHRNVPYKPEGKK